MRYVKFIWIGLLIGFLLVTVLAYYGCLPAFAADHLQAPDYWQPLDAGKLAQAKAHLDPYDYRLVEQYGQYHQQDSFFVIRARPGRKGLFLFCVPDPKPQRRAEP